eukprot:2852194-Rhodomonas_salina.1
MNEPARLRSFRPTVVFLCRHDLNSGFCLSAPPVARTPYAGINCLSVHCTRVSMTELPVS